MANRNIAVTLRAEVGEFKRGLKGAVESIREVEAAAKTTGAAVDQAHSKQAAAAKRVEAAEKNLARVQKSSKASADQKEAATRKLKSALDAQTKANETATRAEEKHAASLKRVEAAQRSAKTTTGSLTQSLKDNERQWQAVGGVLAAYGAATTALTASVVKTGVAYNSLQQTSRAALTTMLGSAEAVGDQMDRLDAFAKTSPFSKQTFITAQQQMLAFGIETEKVVPYLSALNDATAAAGGNSQQLSELAFVMAQISAAGKITGQDLIQFGQRGVNAAELIGSQMGKTGGQIRQDITDGALGADVALDALAAGMSQKFEGASANVKNTFEGATDRVRAAWRDLASELSEPLVGADGGGLFVDAANGLADFLRMVQGLPGPVKAAAGGLTALSGAAALAGAGLILGVPKWQAFQRSIVDISASSPAAAKGLSGLAKSAKLATGALGLIFGAAAITSYFQGAGVVVSSTDDVTKALDRMARAGGDIDMESLNALFAGGKSGANWALGADEQANAIQGIGDAIGRLKASDAEGTLDRVFGQFNESGNNWLGGNAAWNQAEESVKALDASMAALVESGNTEALAVAEQYLRDEMARKGQTIDEALTYLPQYAAAVEDAGAENGNASEKIAENAARLEEQAAATEAAQAAYEAFREVISGASEAFIDIGGAYDAVIEKNKALASETAASTESSKDSWEDYYDGVTVKMGDYLRELEGQVEAQQNWQANMTELAGKVSEETLLELAKMGPEGAPLVAELVDASEKTLSRLDMATVAKTEVDAFVGELLAAQGRLPELEIHATAEGAQVELNRFIQSAKGQRVYVDIYGRSVGLGTGKPGDAIAKASGGSVSGPGTGTSDSIPALLSNGEHVFTASDVQKAGGQSAMYRMRGMIQSGLLRFAAGGAVGGAQREQAAALREVDRLKRLVISARRSKASESRQEYLEKRLESARDKYAAARDKVSALRDSRADLSTDVRRGNIVEQGTSGLSGALSVVDRVLAASQDSNLSSGKRSGLAKRAAAAEPALKRQYDLLEQANAAIEKQRDLTQDVLSLRDQIANSIRGEVKLTDTLGGKTDLGYDKPVTSGAIRAYVQEKLGKINTLNARVNALRLKKVPNGLIQEILSAGVDGGSELAQALLTGPASDLAAISSTWGHVEQAALNTGGIATLSQYGTTAYQAEAELARRETAADKIEGSIERLIGSLQQGLVNSYGMATGGWVSGGVRGKDSVPRLLMPDEFVVNAKSAKANASLLEAVNSGVRLSLPSVSRPAIQAAPVGGSSVDAVAAITAALTQMTVQVVNQFGVRESARIVSAGIGEVARNDPGQLRGAMTKAGV